MSSPVMINTLEISDVKKVKAVRMNCAGRHLTVIGGNNGEGKTTILDSIAFALGGERFRPTDLKRDGSMVDPNIKVTLSNGFIVERKGKNSALKVTDPTGAKAGQALLSDFVSQFALDLPRFLQSTNKEKTQAVLGIIGVGDQLTLLDNKENQIYERRHQQGQTKDQKRKYADEMPFHADAPEDLISAGELIKRQQAIILKNAENQKLRDRIPVLDNRRVTLEREIEELMARLQSKRNELDEVQSNLLTAKTSAKDLQDQSTAELEAQLDDVELVNSKVRSNLDKQKAMDDATRHEVEYAELTKALEEVRQAKIDLLESADLPLEGMSVDNGNILYQGKQWDCMSSAEQLIVATAIVRKTNPACGFVLLDKLEQMDLDTLNHFNEWLIKENLQVIATRVSTGDECSIIIEDGQGTLGAIVTQEAKTPRF